MRKNVTLNLDLVHTKVSKEEVAKFLIALGNTCAEVNATPLQIVGQITRAHWHIFAEAMLQAGIPPHDFERVYEECCGVLFGLWP